MLESWFRMTWIGTKSQSRELVKMVKFKVRIFMGLGNSRNLKKVSELNLGETGLGGGSVADGETLQWMDQQTEQMKGRQMNRQPEENEEMRTESKVGELHEFDGSESDRTGFGRREMVKGSLK